MVPQITILFVGLMALIQIPMTFAVGLYRVKTDIHFLDGGDVEMLRRIRAHANFTETVPITLLAMAAAELSGAPAFLIWTGGALLVAGRLLHYVTIRRFGWAIGRAVGMAMTFLPMAGFALYAAAAGLGLA